MKREMDGVKKRLERIEGTLDTVQSDVAGLKADVHDLKSDLKSVKTDVREMKDLFTAQLQPMMKKMAVAITKTTTDLAEFKAYAMENFVTRGEFHSRMDSMVTKLEDSRFDWTKQGDRLDQHDKRLSRLEARRA